MGRNSLEVITARRTKPRSADDWRIFSQLGRPGEIPVYWMEYCQLRRFRLVDNSINQLGRLPYARPTGRRAFIAITTLSDSSCRRRRSKKSCALSALLPGVLVLFIIISTGFCRSLPALFAFDRDNSTTMLLTATYTPLP